MSTWNPTNSQSYFSHTNQGIPDWVNSMGIGVPLFRQKFEVPKMEVLNLIRLFWWCCFPYISLRYSFYSEYLHFRYLKCFVIIESPWNFPLKWHAKSLQVGFFSIFEREMVWKLCWFSWRMFVYTESFYNQKLDTVSVSIYIVGWEITETIIKWEGQDLFNMWCMVPVPLPGFFWMVN